jgi:uncharacterized delta-60 repeat protein
MHARTFVRASLVLAASLSLAGSVPAAQLGVPDTSFGSSGLVTTDFLRGADSASAVAVLPDGRVVVAGSAGIARDDKTVFAVARYEVDGALDYHFAGNGFVTTAIGGSSAALAVARDASGRIVAAGRTCASARSANCQIAVARYWPDGALDSSFGQAGVAILKLGTKHAEATALTILPSGRMLVAGTQNDLFVIARLEPDGSLDATFGQAGVATLGFGRDAAAARALLAEPSGDIVVAGSALGAADHDFALGMFDDSGRLDVLCGVDGRVRADFDGAHDAATALALAADGGILVAGEATMTGSPTTFAVMKLHADGSTDTAFGTQGHALVSFPSDAHPRALLVLPSGTIVAAGAATRSATDADLAFAFLTPAGALDPAFGTDGIVTHDVLGGLDTVNGLAVAPGGRMIAAGSASSPSGGDVVVARYLVARAGDANWDGIVDLGDFFAIVNHLFAGAPAPIGRADANGDGLVDVKDVFFLLNSLYVN